MNVQVTGRPTVQPVASSKLAIADGDIHPQRNSIQDIFPWLEKRWQEHALTFGNRPRQAYQAGPAYPKGQPNASRRDAWPPEGGRPGSSLARVSPVRAVLACLTGTIGRCHLRAVRGLCAPAPRLAGAMCPSPRYPAGMTAAARSRLRSRTAPRAGTAC